MVSVKEINDENMLKAGEEIFKVQCQSCHTIDGYNWDKENSSAVGARHTLIFSFNTLICLKVLCLHFTGLSKKEKLLQNGFII
jgi:hypothetical protein